MWALVNLGVHLESKCDLAWQMADVHLLYFSLYTYVHMYNIISTYVRTACTYVCTIVVH